MEHLSRPGRIGHMELKNRMVLAPMGVTVGNLKQEDVAFYLRRAQGGAALVFCNIKASCRFESAEHSIHFCDETKELFREIVDSCHAYGCKVGAQIMPGDGRIGGPSIQYRVPISASDCPWMHAPKLRCHALTVEEIQALLGDYRESAAAAVECGADCIEIHAYGGYLTDQFLTARWNTRTDAYGGSLENRARFVKELIEICKDVGGADFPVIVKFTPDHCIDEPGYRTMEEGIALARLLESYGADALHVDVGCHDNWYRAMPPMALQDVRQYEAARQVKAAVTIPVLTNGKLGKVETAEALLADGVLDYAVIGRGLLADPDLPTKVQKGSAAEIRPCIACNAGCIAQVYAGKQATCAVNPRCGREYEPELTAQQPKRVLVIGGGPAGCAAALFAKQAGHDVTLWEASARLGGKLHAAAAPYFKRDMHGLIDYYTGALVRAGVPVVLNRRADRETVTAFAPDVILWAAGAEDTAGSIPGLECPLYTAAQALTEGVNGERILVLGGGLTAVETALHYAGVGKHVTSIARRTFMRKPEFTMNEKLTRKMMAESTAEFLEYARVCDAGGNTVTLEVAGEADRKVLAVDAVITAMGSRERSCKFDDIAPVIAVGDALGAANVMHAVHSAWEAVKQL